MTLNFSIQDMVQCLTKIGYTIKQETETITVNTYHDNTEEVEINVFNCYYLDDIKPAAPWAGAGYRRVQYVFEQELHKKLINLF
jgi:hypothetical protein